MPLHFKKKKKVCITSKQTPKAKQEISTKEGKIKEKSSTEQRPNRN